MNRTENRLAFESSPYLLQHADNPVHWQPWGGAAFREAADRDVPVFLSIGYATCHWCHVMEQESFDDKEVADLLNSHFVCIKVDREERPDIDNQYMQVCQLMTGSGGWPLTVFLTPDKRPFFTATYIPKTARYGRSGLMDLLPRIRDLWRSDRDRLLESTERMLALLTRSPETESGHGVNRETIQTARRLLEQRFDPVNGGFGEAPKFPAAHHLDFLFQYGRNRQDPTATEMALRTLEKIASGGIHDQVGGGFHRYSTDSRWHVPHFEKMLYDQALLMMQYGYAYRTTGRQLYLRAATRTAAYVKEILTDPDGAFMSAEDADTDGVEGAFYRWQPGEIEDALGSDASFVIDLFSIRESGNFSDPVHGQQTDNILYMKDQNIQPGLQTATESKLFERLDPLLDRLKQRRTGRTRPIVDHKIPADWNGMMIAALASLSNASGDTFPLEMATQAMSRIIDHEQRIGFLPHICRKAPPIIPGFLDDYAWLITATLNLYQADFKPEWIRHAIRLGKTLLSEFELPDGGFRFTSDRHEKLLFQRMETMDGAIPAGNAVALAALLRLARLTGDPFWFETANRTEAALDGHIRLHPVAHTATLAALIRYRTDNPALVACGPDLDSVIQALQPLRNGFYPELEIVVRTPDTSTALDEVAPYTGGMKTDDEIRFYLCTGQTCQTPTTDIGKVIGELDRTANENL